MGRIETPDLKRLRASLWLVWQLIPTRAKWRSSPSACCSVLRKVLDSVSIVREAMSRQLGGEEEYDLCCYPLLAHATTGIHFSLHLHTLSPLLCWTHSSMVGAL